MPPTTSRWRWFASMLWWLALIAPGLGFDCLLEFPDPPDSGQGDADADADADQRDCNPRQVTSIGARSIRYLSFLATYDQLGLMWASTAADEFDHVSFLPLSSDGSPIGSPVDVTGGPSSHPWLVATNRGYAAAWVTSGETAEVRFARLTEGGVIDGEVLEVTTEPTISWQPSLVFTYPGFAVAWVDYERSLLLFTRIADDGSEADEPTDVQWLDTNWTRPSLAWDGDTGYGLVWEGHDRFGNGEIDFARVSEDGSVPDGPTTVWVGGSSAIWPCITWDVPGFVLLWQEQGTIHLGQLSDDGDLGDPVPVTTSARTDEAYSLNSCVVWTGDDMAVAWVDRRDNSDQVYLGRLAVDGSRSADDLRLTSGEAQRTMAAVALTSTGLAVAWAEWDGTLWEIFVAFLSECS